MGLYPQDVLILLMMVLEDKGPVYQKDIARRLHLSPAAVSYAVKRLKGLGLLSQDQSKIMVQSLLDFVFYAIHLVFPAEVGSEARGILTANIQASQQTSKKYVWRSDRGEHFGQQVSPLYESVPLFVFDEPKLYQALACIDAIRVGNSREKKLAFNQLETMLKHHEPSDQSS
ncbi:MAG: MarR family transcriptional regulator [Saprospiraceae bacterium]|nr:MarR family transcriptional regulator [Saprospiraceae bacterium]